MKTHSPACELALSELLTAPADSVDHRMARDIAVLDDDEAIAYLIEVCLQDGHPSRPVEIAALLFPLLRREVQV
jgi:hypothetical protein